MTRGRISRYRHLLVFLLFAGVTIAFTYPVIVRMDTHFSGDNIDVWLNMWVNWWTHKALRQGLPLYYTTDILYPDGAPLYFHSFSHTNTALWLLLEPAMGPLAAYNTTVLVGFTLLGFGMYLVVYELTSHTGAGILAGLAATFAPYHVWECVHPNLFSTQYIALLLWALIALFRRPVWWRGALAGGFFALGVLSGWHQPMYAAVMIGPYLVWSLLARREKWGKDLWRALLVASLVGLGLASGAAFPLLREQMRAGYAEPEIDWVFDTDALALITPSFLHPLWGDAVRPIYRRFPAPNRPAFIGYTVLVLALLGLRHCLQRERRREHGWLAIATPLSLVFALGTRLYVNGDVVLSNLPWYNPIIGFIRTPIRLNMMLGQCLAILAGFAVAALLRKRTGWQASAAAVALATLVLFEFLAWPFPTTQAYASPFYLQLARESGSFAIVEAPLDRQTDKFYMYWQTIHGKPLVNGHISRPPTSAFDFIQGNGITRAFAHREPLRGNERVGVEREALARTGIRYMAIHKQFLPTDLATDWIAALATRPVYEDADLAVFATRPEAGVAFGVMHDFNGLLLSQTWLEAGPPAILESHWSSPASQTVTLTLHEPGGRALYSQVLTVEGAGFSALRTPLSLPDLESGEYELSFSVNGESFVSPQRLVITPGGRFAARLQPNAMWNESIVLRGLDWHRLADTLVVDLRWEARQVSTTDHADEVKAFVHLLREDGTLASQFDGVPHSGTYPISLWKAGEQVADQASIALHGVPAGLYRLAIGWYVPGTSQRLAGVDGSGRPLPEGRLVLDQAVVIP